MFCIYFLIGALGLGIGMAFGRKSKSKFDQMLKKMKPKERIIFKIKVMKKAFHKYGKKMPRPLQFELLEKVST